MKTLKDRTFVVKLKPEGAGSWPVLAARVEIHDEHLALVQSSGKLSGLFLMEIIETVIPLPEQFQARPLLARMFAES